MWELDYKESWALKNWCFWTVVLERTLESPFNCKEIKPVNPKRNQPFPIFIGRTDTEDSILWSLMWRPDSLEKNLMLGKIEGRRRGGTTEDEVVRWHHWFNGNEFEQAPGDGEGQRNLACYSPWGHKKLDTTEWLNNNCLCHEFS